MELTERTKQVLGLGSYKPKEKYVCFLPFRGEFGWYIMNFVKRVQGFNHENKIVCIKPGHECLFPSAKSFFYDWQDYPDHIKAGIIPNDDEEKVKNKIRGQLGTDDVYFLSPSETSWEEKTSLANCVFEPKSVNTLGLKVDVVICPRKRKIDPHRNWLQDNWQFVVNKLVKNNITVGVCGGIETTFILQNIKHKSYDYVDIDSDVELMNGADLVIAQESGLAYLSYLCKKPTMIIDNYMGYLGADLHRDDSIPFKEVKHVWFKPELLVDEIMFFLKTLRWSESRKQ